MLRKTHKLSWSNTRISLLEYCEKKYFLNYYTGALKRDFPEIRKQAQILKRCKSLEMWIGEKTHYLISDYFKAIQKGHNSEDILEFLKEKMIQEMKSEFISSKTKDYRILDFDSKGGLSEHYYGENIDERLQDAIDKVVGNFDALLASEWGNKVIGLIRNHHGVYIEEPRVPDFEAMKVALDGLSNLKNINIMASPDFGVVMGNGEYYILDRKTGKEPLGPHSVTDQLKVYALKLLLNAKHQPIVGDWKITAYEVYLPSMSVYGGRIEQGDIDEIVKKIEQDVEFQKKFLVDEDVVRNEPVESVLFSRTLSKQKCESCTFRKVCDQLAELKR